MGNKLYCSIRTSFSLERKLKLTPHHFRKETTCMAIASLLVTVNFTKGDASSRTLLWLSVSADGTIEDNINHWRLPIQTPFPVILFEEVTLSVSLAGIIHVDKSL